MVCAIQYIERKGVSKGASNYGGYIIIDGMHCVFLSTTTPGNMLPLYRYLGNGDDMKGRTIYRAALKMPTVLLQPGVYNSLIASIDDAKVIPFKGES